jgi:hypothetical protein
VGSLGITPRCDAKRRFLTLRAAAIEAMDALGPD